MESPSLVLRHLTVCPIGKKAQEAAKAPSFWEERTFTLDYPVKLPVALASQKPLKKLRIGFGSFEILQ